MNKANQTEFYTFAQILHRALSEYFGEQPQTPTIQERVPRKTPVRQVSETKTKKAEHKIPVFVYDKRNPDRLIGRFESITEAAMHCGVFKSSAAACVRGELKSTGNYIFKRANKPVQPVNVEAQPGNVKRFVEKTKKTGRHAVPVVVSKVENPDKILYAFDSICQASTAMMTSQSAVSNCVNGKKYSVNGYVFRRANNPATVDVQINVRANKRG